MHNSKVLDSVACHDTFIKDAREEFAHCPESTQGGPVQKRLTLGILESRRSWSKSKPPPSATTPSLIMSWKMGKGDVRPSHDSRLPIEPERDRDRDLDRDLTRFKEVGSSFSMEVAERPTNKED